MFIVVIRRPTFCMITLTIGRHSMMLSKVLKQSNLNESPVFICTLQIGHGGIVKSVVVF